MTFLLYSNFHFSLNVDFISCCKVSIGSPMFLVISFFWKRLVYLLHCNPVSPRKPKCCYDWQNPLFRLIIFRAWFLLPRSQSKSLYFLRSASLSFYQFVFFSLKPDEQKLLELLVVWPHLEFRTHVSPRDLNSIPLSKSHSKTFYMSWTIMPEIIDSPSCSAIQINQNC